MVIEESNLKFDFAPDVRVIKFDDSDFYRKEFNKLPSAKGVDIVADSKETLQLIEVAKKVASTIACLTGAWTKSERMEKAAELAEFCRGIKSRNKKMMMARLQNSMNQKLSWLNCQVSVVDSCTYQTKYFQVS